MSDLMKAIYEDMEDERLGFRCPSCRSRDIKHIVDSDLGLGDAYDVAICQKCLNKKVDDNPWDKGR